MNDIFYFVRECDLYGYADDNTLSKAAKDEASLKRALERDTANTLSWFTENYMSANPDKFECKPLYALEMNLLGYIGYIFYML